MEENRLYECQTGVQYTSCARDGNTDICGKDDVDDHDALNESGISQPDNPDGLCEEDVGGSKPLEAQQRVSQISAGSMNMIESCKKRQRLWNYRKGHTLHTEPSSTLSGTQTKNDDMELAVEILRVMMEDTCVPRADCLETTQKARLRPSWRKMVVDWMAEVAKGFNLQFETLAQAVALLDRALSNIMIPRSAFQKVGLACILVASKVNECVPLGMKSVKTYFSRICDVKTLCDLELRLVVHVDWTLCSPNVGSAVSLLTFFLPTGNDVLPIAQRILQRVIARYDTLKFSSMTLALAAIKLICRHANLMSDYEELEQLLASRSIHIVQNMGADELIENVVIEHFGSFKTILAPILAPRDSPASVPADVYGAPSPYAADPSSDTGDNLPAFYKGSQTVTHRG